MLVASSITYGLYAIHDPRAAVESALPAAYVSLMVSTLLLGWIHRRQNGKR